MLEILKPGDTATTEGIFVGIPNLPNSFTEDYAAGQTIEYKQGRFILSVFQRLNQIVSATDFLNNPDVANKLGISLSITPIRIDADTEDRVINLVLTKILDVKTDTLKPIVLGDPLDDTFPTGLFDVGDLFPMGQLLNAGDQVSYAGAVISEAVLLANGLSGLTLSTDGLAFIEAFLKGIFASIPSQNGGLTSTLLPYIKPRVQIISSPLNTVSGLFEGVQDLIANLYFFFATVSYSLTIRMKITADRTTVSTT